MAADMVHEAIGHGLASWLVGDRILSISTVALQNAMPNRIVAACGTLANVIVGALSLWILRRARTFAPSACFMWLFGAFNLFNSGYLVASALLGNGDWAVVIDGFAPPCLWRLALGVAGAALYMVVMRSLARDMLAFVESGEVAVRDVHALTLPAYIAGGALMTAASVFNPIGPSLILTSGVGASFGLNWGFLLLPGMIHSQARNRAPDGRGVSFSPLWAGLALLASIAFIALLGPGIRFGPRR